MAYGSVNAGSGASSRKMEEIEKKIQDARKAVQQEIQAHKEAENPHGITPDKIDAVPETRKINNKPLTGDITLNFEDLGSKAFHVGTSAPANKNLLWIDTNTSTGGLKYHNGSAWVLVASNYS